MVEFNDALEKVGNTAFFNCTSLTSLEFNDALEMIGSCAFYGCTSVGEVVYIILENDCLCGTLWMQTIEET